MRGKVACSMQKLLFLIKFAAVFFKPCQVVVDFGYQLTRASGACGGRHGNLTYGGYPAKFERVIKLFGFGYGVPSSMPMTGRGLDVTDQ